MQQQRISQSGLIVLAGLLTGSPVVAALEIEPGAGVGLLYTDNARLTADDEEDDLALFQGMAAALFDQADQPVSDQVNDNGVEGEEDEICHGISTGGFLLVVT